ncbi:ImmA/IrrE family metallo-endopeptidase [Tabrizicola aquatica]|uniref:ImmA/IrrE family metallo-endopeptidase n=1 Tax=Tabrizicola aquatica TaxID=909926 RepID=UPI0011AF5065|nr:ImmA/IrrE family metallo-endopeptidase [Tabrizicola aquatica]
MSGYLFSKDPRIQDWERQKLRSFCTTLERDTVVLAGQFGLKVFQKEMLPYERGSLDKAPEFGSKSGWVIRVNGNDRLETQNFTIAHELGHFVLHRARLAALDAFDGRVHRDSENATDPFTYLDERDPIMEAEANGFAAALLMPLNLFRPAHRRLNGDCAALSRLFVVSEGAVRKRVIELRDAL